MPPHPDPLRLLALTPLVLAAGITSSRPAAPSACPGGADGGGLTVPAGFCASVLGQDLGAVRQLAVAPNGDLYAAVRGGALSFRGGVLALRVRDGRPEARASFGPRGGNDVAVHGGFLYLALDDRILRYRLTGELEPKDKAETIVGDLPDDGNHTAKSIAFGGGDTMFVSIGSATNSCQEEDRAERSPGRDPCRELETRAGIWWFSATRPNQRFRDGRRYATGLRNPSAIGVKPATGDLWAASHGRDQLSANWGFSDQVNASDPAEELVRVTAGSDFGWPYCYYSNTAEKKVLAPEYGGNGQKVGRCEPAAAPAVAFPGHWAPLALAFYPGNRFGPEYQGGLFLAFHGSWNRAPLPQAGYRVVFVPFADGRPTGKYRTFATGTEGPTSLRASGVAVAPDGALYISADQNGKIWRVMRERT